MQPSNRFGIVFLIIYAMLSFKSAFKNESLQIDGNAKTNPLNNVEKKHGQ